MGKDEVPAYAAMDALFEVQFQVYAEDDLGDKDEGEECGEAGVDVGGELAAFVGVAENVAEEGK